jgi:NADPH:quinone reductase-like Zn-dependent oxidoreductase
MTTCARSAPSRSPTARGSSSAPAPDGVDAALDAAVGGAVPALIALAGGAGRVVAIADYQGPQQTGARMSGGPGTQRAVHALRDIAPLIESGRFSLPIAQTFPLEAIAAAHRVIETGHVRGKLILLVT